MISLTLILSKTSKQLPIMELTVVWEEQSLWMDLDQDG